MYNLLFNFIEAAICTQIFSHWYTTVHHAQICSFLYLISHHAITIVYINAIFEDYFKNLTLQNYLLPSDVLRISKSITGQLYIHSFLYFLCYIDLHHNIWGIFKEKQISSQNSKERSNRKLNPSRNLCSSFCHSAATQSYSLLQSQNVYLKISAYTF